VSGEFKLVFEGETRLTNVGGTLESRYRDTQAARTFGVYRAPLQELRLRTGRRFESELAISIGCGDPALRRAFDVAFHDQIRLVHFFNRAGFFAYRDCERTQTNRSAIELVN